MWEIILAIIPNDYGFIIYLAPGEFLDGCCFSTDYVEIFDEYGIRKYEYNERTDTWSEPLEFWGKKQIRDYLELPTQKINCYLHSFYIKKDYSFFTVWSFDFYGSNENLRPEYENKFILSYVDSFNFSRSNPIISQEVPYQNNQFMQFVPYNNSYFLYASGYTKRSILNINGSLSNWQDIDNINYTRPNIPFNGIYFKRDWDHSIITVAKRYLFFDYGTNGRILVDLVNENQHEILISFPFDISPSSSYREIEFEMINDSSLEEIFFTALITAETIELWQFNYQNNNLTLISSLNKTMSEYSGFLSGQMKIDLISDGEKWRIFWSQRVEESLNEIFTVYFDVESQEWSSVIQLTFTNDIKDDYYPSPGFEPVSMVFFYLSLVAFIFFIFALVVYLLLRKPSS